jgi:hypothetical protein
MAIIVNPKCMVAHPDYETWQELLISHPDGEPGVPIVVGEYSDRLILVDCVGHKLIFPLPLEKAKRKLVEDPKPRSRSKTSQRVAS